MHNKMQLEKNRYWQHTAIINNIVMLVIITPVPIQNVLLVLPIVILVLMLQHAKHVL